MTALSFTVGSIDLASASGWRDRDKVVSFGQHGASNSFSFIGAEAGSARGQWELWSQDKCVASPAGGNMRPVRTG